MRLAKLIELLQIGSPSNLKNGGVLYRIDINTDKENSYSNKDYIENEYVIYIGFKSGVLNKVKVYNLNFIIEDNYFYFTQDIDRGTLTISHADGIIYNAKGFEIKQIINTSIDKDLENILNEIKAKTNIIIKDRDKKRKESADDIQNAFDYETDMTDTFE